MLNDQLLQSWMCWLEAQWRARCGPKANWPVANVDVRKVVAGATGPVKMVVELHGSKREPLS